MRENNGYETLRKQPSRATGNPENSFQPHPDYDDYLKIHKVLVGEATAVKLENIFKNLSKEKVPHYLSVAGWAATEAALAQPHRSASYRNELLSSAGECWTKALETQLLWNQSGAEHLIDDSAPYRHALDLAHLPLIQAMISGEITESVRKSVTCDVLNIAEDNAVRMQLAKRADNQLAVSDHVGVGHECNALLAFHSLNSPGLFAIPSSARADSGHHHPHQTHDILVIQRKWGNVIDMTPIEIKAKASQSDRKRYKALLVRGKMHLSVEGHHTPEHTLRAFSAYFNGTQSRQEQQITDHARLTILDLYWLYKKGEKLQDFASNESRCQYRDASKVQEKHPEIAPDYSI